MGPRGRVREQDSQFFPAVEKVTESIAKADGKTLQWLGKGLRAGPGRPIAIGEGELRREFGSLRPALMFDLLRIRDKAGCLLPFELNEAQRELEANAGRRSIVLKARQLGVTTYIAAKFFLHCISRPGTLCVQVAHDQCSAEEIFRIVHRLLANLPRRLRQGALTTSRANVRQIVFPRLDSEYRVETAADPNAGRGLTIHNLHCSEVARWPRDAAATLSSLRAAVPPNGEIVLESTANGAGGVFYDEWQRAGETGYSRHFFPWWMDAKYRLDKAIKEFTEEELELMRKHHLDAQQVAFRREMRANFKSRAAEEYAEDAESCFLASGECVFDIDVIEQELKEQRHFESHDGGRLLRFFPPTSDGGVPREYIVGVDPAGGGSEGDFSVAQVIDRYRGMQCAELRGHFSIRDFACRVKLLAEEYNNAEVVVERNNHGHGVLAYLATMNYLNLYGKGDNAGWLTTSVTRPHMLEHFVSLLSSAPMLFSSPRLLEECRTFIRHADGSCSAANGTHDDTVMAMAIAQAVRAEHSRRERPPAPAMAAPGTAATTVAAGYESRSTVTSADACENVKAIG